MRRSNLEIESDNTGIKYYYDNSGKYTQPIVEIPGLGYDVKCKTKKDAIALMNAYSYKKACKLVNKCGENRKLNELSNKNYSRVVK